MAADRSDRDAGTVYRALAPGVLAYLRSQHVQDAEDVLGDVFYQVARDLHRVKGDEAAVRRWVFTVARHRVIDAGRRRRRRPQVAPGPFSEVAAASAAAAAAAVSSAAASPAEPFDPALVAALAGLTLDQREVVVLRFVADLSLEAVARITRRRVGAVKALQVRGLANLASALSPVAVSPEALPAL